MSEPESTLHTRPSLLVRLRDARDGDSWRTFVDIYAPLIYRWCRRHSPQDADAADLTQEVLAEVVRCIRTFEYQPQRGRFRDWLGTVTRRRLARFLERHQRDVAASGEALEHCGSSGSPDAEWTADFNAHILRVALDRIRPHFEPATWRAFELAWIENRPALDTAATLGLPIEKVYVAKSRVLKRLEEEVLALAEDLPQFVPLG